MKTHLDSHSKPSIGLLLAASALLPLALIAADTSRPTTPVTVEGPVNVQGVVEVLNDILHQPYLQTIIVDASDSPTASFDIPDGKRLVVETIAFQASKPTGETTRMFLHPRVNGQQTVVPLSVQSTTVEGAVTYFTAVHPMKLRVDSAPGSTNEIQIRRGFGGLGTLFATVSGYLVDI